MIKKTFKAVLGFTKMAAAVVLSRADAVYAGMKDNPAYPNPPVDLASFKSAIDNLRSAIADSLDGGKKAVAQRNHLNGSVIKMLRQLGHYVEANCKDDLIIFVSSGFEAASTVRSASQSLSQSIRKIDPGPNSGQLLVWIAAVLGANSYELRWAPLGAGGVPGSWIAQPVGKTRPPVTLSGLIPGTSYVFQTRALVQSSFTDWSDSVTRICT